MVALPCIEGSTNLQVTGSYSQASHWMSRRHRRWRSRRCADRHQGNKVLIRESSDSRASQMIRHHFGDTRDVEQGHSRLLLGGIRSLQLQ